MIRKNAWMVKRLVSIFTRAAKRGHYPRERAMIEIFEQAEIPLPFQPSHSGWETMWFTHVFAVGAWVRLLHALEVMRRMMAATLTNTLVTTVKSVMMRGTMENSPVKRKTILVCP